MLQRLNISLAGTIAAGAFFGIATVEHWTLISMVAGLALVLLVARLSFLIFLRSLSGS